MEAVSCEGAVSYVVAVPCAIGLTSVVVVVVIPIITPPVFVKPAVEVVDVAEVIS